VCLFARDDFESDADILRNVPVSSAVSRIFVWSKIIV